MDRVLRIILIIVTMLFALFIIRQTSKQKLNYRLTIIWGFFSLFTVILAIFPQIIMWFSALIHIKTPVNAIFLVYIFLLIVMLVYISVEMYKIQKEITILIQENGLLNKKIDDLKNKIEKE